MTEFAKDLAERFDFAAYHFLSAWEHDSEGMIDDKTTRNTTDSEQRRIDMFEKLRDTVDHVPTWMFEWTRELQDFVGPEQFGHALCKAIQGIGSTFVPNDASDFVKMLNLSLSFCRHDARTHTLSSHRLYLELGRRLNVRPGFTIQRRF